MELRISFLLLILACLQGTAFASVLAIDYGADFIKASLMKPGVPFDVLLNKDSKRKIQASVAWKHNGEDDSDRLFGGDAFNLASRYPRDSFSAVKLLQAVPFDSPLVSYYTSISTATLVPSDRKTTALQTSTDTSWSSEELIAMQFAYIKSLAESTAGEKVTDVIVTVPPYYSQYERDAVADAIEISGLRTLALVNDGTAIAVNYAMTRTFSTPETHVIFDAGASSTRATVVQFSPTSNTGKEPGTKITVLGVGYDRGTGGIELDRRLRDLLIHDFNHRHKRQVRENKRAMAKLWKEAGRVKAILSANTETFVTVESLAWDIDFKTKISRSSFEDACADLQPRFAQPILDALQNAGIDLSAVSSVIMAGGSSRTPMIQNAVKAAVGDDKIALNVNADEAAVLGAALHGASLSRQFKTKNIKVQDITAHDVQVSYLAAPPTPESRPRAITSVIFGKGSKTGSKKVMTFKRSEDFDIALDYVTEPAPGFPTRMLEVTLEGVTEAVKNLTEDGASDIVVKATLSLSESGFVSVKDAVATGEFKDDSLTGKLKSILVGSGSSASSEENEEPETEARPSPSSSSSASSSSESPSSSDEDVPPSESPASNGSDNKDKVEKEAPKPKVPPKSTYTLTISNHFGPLAPMTIEEKQASRARLRQIDAAEAAKTRKEEARNTLESYLYRLRDLLDNVEDGHETPFQKCSKAEERKMIQSKMEETLAWMNENGDEASTTELLAKRSDLESYERPVVHRYKEIEAFPQALNNSQLWNFSSKLFLIEARKNLTSEQEAGLPSKWTKDELDSLEKTLKDHEQWLEKWVEKQKTVPMNEDPVIETKEMKARAKVLENHLHKLVKRKIPKAPVKKPEQKPVEENKDGGAAEGEKAGTPPPVEEEKKEQVPPTQEDDSKPKEDIRDEL